MLDPVCRRVPAGHGSTHPEKSLASDKAIVSVECLLLKLILAAACPGSSTLALGSNASNCL